MREEETAQRSASKRTFLLTKENLQNLQAVHEAEYSLQGRSLNDFHRPTRTINSRSPEKKTRSGYRRGEDLYDHSHILSSGGLKKSSTGMAKEEKSSSVQLDADANGVNGDMETQPGSGDSAATQPSSPSTDDAPGAFPTESNENGTADEGMRSPTPPPHKISPKVDPEACKAAGNKFFKAKDYDRAIAEYSKAVDADPTNSTYLSNRAAAFMSANKFSQALGDSLQAARLDATNEKIQHRLARIYTSLGRPEDALNVYEKLPNTSAADTAAAQRALQCIEMAEKQLSSRDGDGKMALWSIDQAKQTLGFGTPMPRKWLVLRAKANLQIGSPNSLGEVQSIAQSLMRDNPMDAEAMTLAGRAFYLRDEKNAGRSDYQRAEDCFRKALSFDPDLTLARGSLRTMKKLERARNEANEAYKRSQWQQAIDGYTSALEIDATNKITNAKILGNRALAGMKLEHWDEARADCDQALKLDPTYTKAKKTRAKITGESGDWEQAVKDLKALADELQGDAEIQRDLRNAELELKKSKRKDWYKILGVPKDAGDKEIERAYKKKAAVLHPDKTQGDKEKEEMFKDCLEAKETLLDAQKRQIYDSGADLMEPGMGGFGMGGHPFGGGFGGGPGGVQIDPEMLFNMMGGGMGGGGGRGGGFPGGGFTFSTGGMPGGSGRGGYSFG